MHQRGNPPGFLLVLEAMDTVGLAAAWPVAMLSIVATIAVPAAVLVAVRATADANVGPPRRPAARRRSVRTVDGDVRRRSVRGGGRGV